MSAYQTLYVEGKDDEVTLKQVFPLVRCSITLFTRTSSASQAENLGMPIAWMNRSSNFSPRLLLIMENFRLL